MRFGETTEKNSLGGKGRMGRTWRIGLDKIPEVAIKILEHGYGAVRSFLGLANEVDPCLAYFSEVTPEIVRFQEEKDPIASLAANERLLLWLGSPGQKDGIIGPEN